MFSLHLIIELFSLAVIAVSILGSMWLAGHIYTRYLNWQVEQEENTPPSDEQEE